MDERPSYPAAVPDPTLWGIHGGRTGDADRLFLARNVALGWARLGDLGELADAYPEKRPGAIPNNAGQLFRVVHEMAVGDLITYSSSPTPQVPLSRVTGDDVIELGGHAYQAHQRASHIKRTNPSA